MLGPNVLLAHASASTRPRSTPRADGTRGDVPGHGDEGGPRRRGERPDAGVAGAGHQLALGFDSPNNSNHLDRVRDENMAAIRYKDARQDTAQIPAEPALEMATRLGARALGARRGDRLHRARQAAPTSSSSTRRGPQWQALFNPINNLVYNADGGSVHTVIVDGRVVVDAHRQSFVDEAPLFAQRPGDRRAPARADRGGFSRGPAGPSSDRGVAPPARLAGGPRRAARRAPGRARRDDRRHRHADRDRRPRRRPPLSLGVLHLHARLHRGDARVRRPLGSAGTPWPVRGRHRHLLRGLPDGRRRRPTCR